MRRTAKRLGTGRAMTLGSERPLHVIEGSLAEVLIACSIRLASPRHRILDFLDLAYGNFSERTLSRGDRVRRWLTMHLGPDSLIHGRSRSGD